MFVISLNILVQKKNYITDLKTKNIYFKYFRVLRGLSQRLTQALVVALRLFQSKTWYRSSELLRTTSASRKPTIYTAIEYSINRELQLHK